MTIWLLLETTHDAFITPHHRLGTQSHICSTAQWIGCWHPGCNRLERVFVLFRGTSTGMQWGVAIACSVCVETVSMSTGGCCAFIQSGTHTKNILRWLVRGMHGGNTCATPAQCHTCAPIPSQQARVDAGAHVQLSDAAHFCLVLDRE